MKENFYPGMSQKNDIFFHCQGINAEKAYLKRLTEKNRGCRKNMTFTKM
jgi:hypothetical protein